MYTKKFADLPKEIQEKAQAYLPPTGKIWPVGRGDYLSHYNIDACTHFDFGASRGIVVCAQK